MADESAPSTESISQASLERIVQSALQAHGSSTAEASGDLEPSQSEAAADLARVLLSEKYSGAFPHPSVLRDLDGVIHNGAERAFSLTEKEQQHRHECDRKLVDAEVRARDSENTDRRLIIILAAVILVLSLIGAFAAIMTGHPGGAGLAGGAGVVALGGLWAVVRKQSKGSKDTN